MRSFGELSRAVLGAAEWPPSTIIQARSLASLLSKLDRDQELDWLTDRPDVQACLSKALGCSPADLRKPLPADRPTGSRIARLSSLRYGRTLDLAEERLPPGIPDLALDPDRWERVWWVAPSGAGRSLTGHWLEARGLARIGDSPSRVPSFVELPRGAAFEPLSSRVLVAAPTPPTDRAGWQVIASPDIEALLPEIVRWAIERLPPDTALEENATVEWLRSGPLARGELHTLGSVLGWCGVLDELGLDRMRSKTALDVAQRFLNRRLREALGEDHEDYGWTRKHVLDLLVGLARRALTDDTATYASPRELDAWLALIPEPYRAGFDVEWMRLSLARVDSSIRPTDIERAARLLSPGAFRVLRVLRSAELLVGGDDALAPSPHWLAELVSSEAERRVLDGSPFEWGEALLRPHAAPRLTRHLFARALSLDMTALAKLVESEGEDSPAHAAAVETCFRVTGIALLLGVELDPELIEALWEEQSELWLTANGAPIPRIEHPADEASTSLLTRGAWYAAALALGESLDLDLAAWRVPDVFDAIHAAARVADALGEAWGMRIAPLVDRLRSDTAPHVLELPGVLLDGIERGELKWSSVTELDGRERGRFLEAARARKLELDSIARVLFGAWHAADAPPLRGTLLDPENNPLFRALPSELVGLVLRSADAEQLPIVASGWGAEQLTALARSISDGVPGPEQLTALLASVEEPALVRVMAECLDADVASEHLAPFWRVAPEAASEELSRRILAGDVSAALSLSRAAPDAYTDRVVTAWRASELPRYELAALTPFLHRKVGSRAPGWREAYALLGEIERGRASA